MMRNIFTLLAGPALATVVTIGAAQAQQSGTFEGQGGHESSGSVQIVEEDGAFYVELGDDFRLDRAPDPQVAFGSGGYDASTLMGELESRRGGSRYQVPGGIDPTAFDEVWIWCVQADVPLAVAPLS